MKRCRCRCCCRVDVVVDAHATLPRKSEGSINGGEEPKILQDKKLAILPSTSSLYYFDALDQPEEEEEESDEFFDVLSVSECLLREADDDDTLLETVSCATRRRRQSEEWGFPGSLTPRQLTAYQEFRAEIQKRGGTYQEMVYCYREIEPEPYALCRFLRWANFNPNRVLRYMDEYTKVWQDAKKENFYPDASVGCPLSILLTQFPSIYTGFAKEGFPVCYFHSGSLSVEGVECVTDIERLPNFIWFTMMHDIKRIYAQAIARKPSMKRLEQITVMNLDGLSPNLMTPRTYAVSQQADAVAQIFPEMMYKLIILNAPTFFNILWKTFKYLLDPNTTKRIEIYSSAEKGMERLKELIDETELPSDYGGLAMSTSERILREGREGPVPRRQIVELMTIKKDQETEFELANDEEISLEIYTRSTCRTEFSLFNDGKQIVKRNVTRTGSVPYCVQFVKTKGPGQFTVVGRHSQGTCSVEHFLLVGEVFAIDTK